MLKLKVIACDVLNREISYLASQSECHIDVTFFHQGLHDTPNLLRDMLQKEIDKTNEGFPYNYYNTAPNYDYIVIGYGLCSNGIVGITSSNVPLAVPRGHDCITLLLGSKETYGSYFKNYPGTYWFSTGWIERGWQPSKERQQILMEKYREKYGEENADFIMDTEGQWIMKYRNASFIAWKNMPSVQKYSDFTKDAARFFGWNFIEIPGDEGLLKRMLHGKFNEDEVLVVPPGKKVVQSFDDNIITYE